MIRSAPSVAATSEAVAPGPVQPIVLHPSATTTVRAPVNTGRVQDEGPDSCSQSASPAATSGSVLRDEADVTRQVSNSPASTFQRNTASRPGIAPSTAAGAPASVATTKLQGACSGMVWGVTAASVAADGVVGGAAWLGGLDAARLGPGDQHPSDEQHDGKQSKPPTPPGAPHGRFRRRIGAA